LLAWKHRRTNLQYNQVNDVLEEEELGEIVRDNARRCGDAQEIVFIEAVVPMPQRERVFPIQALPNNRRRN